VHPYPLAAALVLGDAMVARDAWLTPAVALTSVVEKKLRTKAPLLKLPSEAAERFPPVMGEAVA
jgi:hypothetical protein